MKRGSENKPNVGIYGRCNAGKSTLLNLLMDEPAAIVSPHGGTTTDPVKRSVEILNFAPVVFIDTAGVDDNSDLGKQRTNKTIETLYTVDLGIVVYRGVWGEYEQDLLEKIAKQGIPSLILHNRTDDISFASSSLDELLVDLSESTSNNRDLIFDSIKQKLPAYSYIIPSIFGNKVSKNDYVLLVCPIDSEAPSGRLILPQVQAIRDLLDNNAVALVIQPEQLDSVLNSGLQFKMVVTDSQIIDVVKRKIAQDIPLTTFSILLAELKGDIPLYLEGLKRIDSLKDNDRILMLESCSHQTSCEDIGRVKIPKWLKAYTQKELTFDFVSKLSELPQDLEQYALVVQCGGCMVTRGQVQGRIRRVVAANLPITNYGMLIKKIRVV